MQPLRAQEVLRVDRYELFDELASGGMGTVHLGRGTGSAGVARVVAVKRLSPQLAKDAAFRAMFLDEARLASRVRHPNVVPTFDVVEADGEVVLVMELVMGDSLSRLVRATQDRGAEITPAIAVGVMTGALYGLHAAHECVDERGGALGLVHRDVSPQNVMVGKDGIARVVDFGVARAAGRLQTTGQGRLKGKLAYMAPEQLRGERVDRRADVYAAGVLLWELLTMERLFEGDSEAHTLHRALGGALRAPSQAKPGVPRALDEVVMRALAVHPSDRYATAQEMAADLLGAHGAAPPHEVGQWVEACVHERMARIASRVAELESQALDARLEAKVVVAHGETLPGSSVSPARSGSRRSRWRAAASLGLVFALGAGIVRYVPELRDEGSGGVAVSAPKTDGVPSAPPAEPPPPLPSPPPTTPPGVPSSRSDLPVETTPRGNPGRPRAVRPRPSPASTSAAPAKPDCDPPYTRATDGTKVWKPECF